MSTKPKIIDDEEQGSIQISVRIPKGLAHEFAEVAQMADVNNSLVYAAALKCGLDKARRAFTALAREMKAAD